MFTGFVDSATPDGDETRIEALSSYRTQRADRRVPGDERSPATRTGVSARAPCLSYTDDRLRIQGIDNLPTEVFEVLVPVAGLELDEPLWVGGVTLLLSALWEAPPGPIPAAPFGHLALEPYACVAVTFETAAKMLNAETAALGRIELALDGLLASTLYGFSAKPDGTNIPFARSAVHSRPRRLPVVCVYGLGTDRIWVRDTDTHGMAVSVHAGLLHRRWQDLQIQPIPVAMRDMLAALRRAAWMKPNRRYNAVRPYGTPSSSLLLVSVYRRPSVRQIVVLLTQHCGKFISRKNSGSDLTTHYNASNELLPCYEDASSHCGFRRRSACPIRDRPAAATPCCTQRFRSWTRVPLAVSEQRSAMGGQYSSSANHVSLVASIRPPTGNRT